MSGWEDPKSKWSFKWDDLGPSTKRRAPDILELGVFDAVSHFNIECQAALNALTNTAIEPGEFWTENKETWQTQARQNKLQRKGFIQEKKKIASTPPKTQRR